MIDSKRPHQNDDKHQVGQQEPRDVAAQHGQKGQYSAAQQAELAWVLLFEKQKIPYENGPTDPDFSYMAAELGHAEQPRVYKAPTMGERRGAVKGGCLGGPHPAMLASNASGFKEGLGSS